MNFGSYTAPKYGIEDLSLSDRIKYTETLKNGSTLTIDQFKRSIDRPITPETRERTKQAIKRALAKKAKFLPTHKYLGKSVAVDVTKLHQCFEAKMTYKQTVLLIPLSPDTFYIYKKAWKNDKNKKH